MSTEGYRYDVAISYAAEDSAIAEALANTLKKRGVRVFYDQFEKSKIWGKDLVEYLATVYGQQSLYCLVIISKHYPIKKWTKFEFKWVQDRQLKSLEEYLLPLRIDDTELPGLPSTVAYLDWRQETLESVCQAFAQKLQLHERPRDHLTTHGTSDVTARQASALLLRNDTRLARLDDCDLSAIISIPEKIVSFSKIRSAHDRAYGSYISFNRGNRIHRLWAYKVANEIDTKWGQAERFHEADAAASAISNDVTAWLAFDKVWVRYGEDRNAIAVDIPLNGSPARLAILKSPPRVAVTTKDRLYLFDYQANTLLAETEVPNSYTGYSFDSMWFSEDGRLVTSKYASQVIWNNSTLEKLLDLDQFKITAHYVSHVNAFDSTGRFFACIGMGQHLVVVDTTENRVVANNGLPGDGVAVGKDVAFHPEYTNILFCVNGSGEIIVWNALNNSLQILAMEKRQWSTCFFPATNILATVDEEGRCACWELHFIP